MSLRVKNEEEIKVGFMNKYESISDGDGVYVETLDSIIDRIHCFTHFRKGEIILLNVSFTVKEEDGCKYLDCDFANFRIGLVEFQVDFHTLEVV